MLASPRTVRAECGAQASATVSGTTLSIAASASGSCGIAGYGSGFTLYIDGNFFAAKSCDASTCAEVYTASTACMAPGTHEVKIVGDCNKPKAGDPQSCERDTSKTTITTFVVDTEVSP